MSCYLLAQITIRDPERYRRYLDRIDRTLTAHHAQVVAVDDAPHPLEGELSFRRCVLIRFAGEAEALAWYHSPEYQEIAAIRREAADSLVLLVHGRS